MRDIDWGHLLRSPHDGFDDMEKYGTVELTTTGIPIDYIIPKANEAHVRVW